jgi:WD40 repeat protein
MLSEHKTGIPVSLRRLACLTAGFLALAVVALAAGADRPEAKEPPGAGLPEGAVGRLGTLRWRHGEPLTFLAFLPDGKGVVTASQDNTLRLWDRDSGKEIRRFGNNLGEVNLPGQAGMVMAYYGPGQFGVALSADGKILAGVKGTTVLLWDVATGKELKSIKAPSAGLTAVALSPDRKFLAGKGGDQLIYLWDTVTGKDVRQIKNQPKENPNAIWISIGGGSPSLVFSPDGKTLASSETELDQRMLKTFIKLSEVETGKEIRRLPGEQNQVSGVAFSPDGKTLAYGGGASIRLCEVDSGKEIRQLKGSPGSHFLVFSPDGKTLASRTVGNDAIKLWDVETGQMLRQVGEVSDTPNLNQIAFVGFGGGLLSGRDLAFSPDGKVIAAGRHHSVSFYDVATGKEVAQDSGHRGPITGVLLASDGKTAVSTGSDNTVRRWEAGTGKELNGFQAPVGTTCVALAPDGRTVALGNRDNLILLHDSASGKELHKLTGHAGGPVALAFAPDGKTLASRGNDNAIRLAEVATGKELKQITVQPGANPGGPRGAVMVNVRGVGGQGPSLVFAPDGKTLVTPIMSGPVGPWNPAPQGAAGPKNALVFFDVATAKEVRQIELPLNQGVSSFAFSPDGRSLAVENADQTITVYETASGKERLRLGAAVNAQLNVRAGAFVMVANGGVFGGVPAAGPTLAFTPDGRKLAARHGQKVCVWDVAAGKEIKQLSGHQGDVTTLGLSPDGKTLASGSKDTTVLLWDIGALKIAQRSLVELTAQEVEALWADLSIIEGVKAFQTIQAMTRSPKSVAAFLKGQLRPVVPVEQKVFDRWIADLESEEFAVRSRALEELEKLGELAIPSLNKVLAGNPPLETRRRSEELLGKVTGVVLSGEQLRLVRAVEVLEQLGTPEARQVLEALAGGAPGSLPTREAREALSRMTK